MQQPVAVQQQSVITAADRALVGEDTAPGYHLVEAGAVRRFCEATGLSDPIYTDVAAARAAGYPERPVPPTFWAAIQAPGSELHRPQLGGWGTRNLNAGTEYEYRRPAYVGQTLACSARVADLHERTGRSGHMVVTVFEYTWRNASGDVVTRCRLTGIRM
jgi:acyl dehydratase